MLSKDVKCDENLDRYISDNIDFHINELNEPFTLEELSNGLKGLKNNKASSFDKISNKMPKTSGNNIKLL